MAYSTVRYRMSSFLHSPQDLGDTEARAWLPELSVRDGDLALEHGLAPGAWLGTAHRCLGMAVLVYTDQHQQPGDRGHEPFCEWQFRCGLRLPLPCSTIPPAGSCARRAGLYDYRHGGQRGAPAAQRQPCSRLSYANGNALVLGTSLSARWGWPGAGHRSYTLHTDLRHLSLRHSGWLGNALAGQLPLAARIPPSPALRRSQKMVERLT